MPEYRAKLYHDYSAHFGRQRSNPAGTPRAQYEETYRTLPARLDAVVADLGCGQGAWIGWMSSKGFSKLTGVDLSLSELEIARQRQPNRCWIQADVVAFLESQNTAFDLLHAKDIIEHFTKEEFIRFLTAAYGALRPGGELWLLTFNAQSPLSSAIRDGDFTHEVAFTPNSLAQCLRACGFVPVSISGRHYCSSSPGGRVRRLLGHFVFPLARLLLKIRQGHGSPAPMIDLHCTLPDLFAVARKA